MRRMPDSAEAAHAPVWCAAGRRQIDQDLVPFTKVWKEFLREAEPFWGKPRGPDKLPI